MTTGTLTEYRYSRQGQSGQTGLYFDPMERIVPTYGGYWVYGRGCTEPGGGIIPSWGFVPSRSRVEMRRNGHPVIGFGHVGELSTPDEHKTNPSIKTSTPWIEVVASSVVGVVTGWVLEEAVRHMRRKR